MAEDDCPGLAILVTCDYKTHCKNFDPLPGTNRDAEKMRKTYKHFKYDIHELVPDHDTPLNIMPTRIKIITYINKIAAYLRKYTGSTENKVILFTFSGHGCNDDGREMLVANDEEKIDFDKYILLPLTSHKNVAEIPKLFFIDACRGTEDLIAKGSVDRVNVKGRQHTEGNYRIEYSTIPFHKAYSNEVHGSYLLRRLAPKLKESKESLQHIAATVKKEVHDHLGTFKQQCVSVCRLNTGPLYLHNRAQAITTL